MFHDDEFQNQVCENETLTDDEKNNIIHLCECLKQRKELEKKGFNLTNIDDREKLYEEIYPYRDLIHEKDDCKVWQWMLVWM
jgi:hypothetical protein